MEIAAKKSKGVHPRDVALRKDSIETAITEEKVPDKEAFGNALIVLVSQSGIERRRLAALVNISYSTICNAIHGRNLPSQKNLENLLSQLNATEAQRKELLKLAGYDSNLDIRKKTFGEEAQRLATKHCLSATDVGKRTNLALGTICNIFKNTYPARLSPENLEKLFVALESSGTDRAYLLRLLAGEVPVDEVSEDNEPPKLIVHVVHATVPMKGIPEEYTLEKGSFRTVFRFDDVKPYSPAGGLPDQVLLIRRYGVIERADKFRHDHFDGKMVDLIICPDSIIHELQKQILLQFDPAPFVSATLVRQKVLIFDVDDGW